MNNTPKQPLFAVSTPFPRAPRVTLYNTTWYDHILKRHVELVDKQDDVQAVVANVNAVMPGNLNPDNVVFLNHLVTSASGTPLGVVVDLARGEVCTAYYNRSFRIIDPGQALWLQPITG